MTLVPLVAAVEAYVHAHPLADMAAAFLAGGMSARPIECADAVFFVIEKTPLKYPFRKMWPSIRAWFDKVEDRVSANIAQVEKTETPPPSSA